MQINVVDMTPTVFGCFNMAVAASSPSFPIPIPDIKHTNPAVNPEKRWEYASLAEYSSPMTSLI